MTIHAPARSGVSPTRASSVAIPGWRDAGIAAIAALSLALGVGAAAPARADGKDLARALIASAVVGVILHEATKGRAAKDRDSTSEVVPVRDRKHRRGAKVIPPVCALAIGEGRRSTSYYPESCLRNRGVTARLPARCAQPATIYGRRDRVYAGDCLAASGFVLDRSRHHGGWR